MVNWVFCVQINSHFNKKCCRPNDKHTFLKVHIIEQKLNNNQCSIEDLILEQEKYWQAQLFTNLYGMNHINDLKRKRKEI